MPTHLMLSQPPKSRIVRQLLGREIDVSKHHTQDVLTRIVMLRHDFEEAVKMVMLGKARDL